MHARSLGLTLSLAILAFAHAFSASAGPTIIYVNHAATGAADGTSWANAYTAINTGITLASGGEQVWVAQGTYDEKLILKTNVEVYGGFTGTETLLAERDFEANVTTVDATGLADNTVSFNLTTFSRFDGFVITGGEIDQGGGVYAYNADSTNVLANCTITGNTAEFAGGGLYLSTSHLQITNCTIRGNATVYNGGGASLYSSNPQFTNCTFSGNSTDVGGGMDMYLSNPLLNECTFIGNSAANSGGGIRVHTSNPTFTGCTIADNYSGTGGGLNLQSAAVNLTNCTISGNRAGADGGGMYMYGVATSSFTNCTISGNTSGNFGGGIEIADSSPTFTNCTIDNNTSATGGGVYLYVLFAASAPELVNCILSGNTNQAIAEGNGLADVDADAFASYCIFYGNPNGDYFDRDTSAILTGALQIDTLAEASNIFEGNPLFVVPGGGSWTAAPTYSAGSNTTTLTDISAGYAVGALAGRLINVGIAQRFQALILSNTATNIVVSGDLTSVAADGEAYAFVDYHLQGASPAIDAGTALGAPTTDFEGDSRPFNAIVDIGVDEWFDTDADGLSNYEEIYTYDTDPNNADTDGDNVSDGDEIQDGTDPNDSYDSTLIVWVDLAWGGAETGARTTPFDTLAEGIAGVVVNGDIVVKGDSSITTTSFTGTINKRLRLRTLGGKVTIGPQ